MIKIVATVCLAALVGWAPEALSQDTIAVYGDSGSGLSRYTDTTSGSESFDVVVVVDPVDGYLFVEFNMTDLATLYEGVFKIYTQYYGSSPVTDSHVDLGDYVIHPNWGGPCVQPGPVEIIRNTYLDLNGLLPSNIVVAVNPIPQGGPTIVSCGGLCCGLCDYATNRALARVPWTDYSVIDPTWIPGVESSDGVLVLNPNAIAVNGVVSSMGTLKARH